MNCPRQPKDLQQKDVEKALEHAIREFPKEACGVFTRSIGYFPCTNIDPEPNENFRMAEYYQVTANRDDVIALFHSHTNGERSPSIADMHFQMSTAMPWCIAVLDSTATPIDFFAWGSDVIPPLLGREYRSGSMDCFSLIRDAYKLWYDVNLPEFPRDKHFIDKGQNIYLDNYGYANFRLITPEMLKPGDVVLGSVCGRGIINHGAVILNEKEIIHHLAERLSCRADLNRWFRTMNVCLRYKPFDVNGQPRPPKLD